MPFEEHSIEDNSIKYRRKIWEEKHRPNAYRPRTSITNNEELIEKFIQMLSSKAKVLDYGCSEGVLAEYLFQKGLQLTCTDIAENALQLTQQRINSPLLETLQTDTPADLWKREFDGIFCWGVLHHVPPQERPDYIHTFHTMLKPKGILLLTGHSNKTEDFTTWTRISPATWLISHSIDDIEPLLLWEGFKIKENGYIEGKEPRSPIQRYLKYVIAEK